MSENGKQVVARAAAVLKALETQAHGMSLGEIAKQTGLPRTTVHRLVASLEGQQLVITTTNGIRLGPALARLAAAAHVDVADIARPAMEVLGRRTRETVDLSVYRDGHAILVAQYGSDQELRVISAVGTAFPLHCTAHGKALLAEMAVDDCASVLAERPLERRTANTLTDHEAIRATLDNIRSEGVAYDCEEHANGVCGLGVTLKCGGAEHYALSLAVPRTRFDEGGGYLKAELVKCKAEIEARLAPR
ncbi:IclR family transcriptional regulator [Marinobacter bohaiensis]|uniref:IclR family transcriptional regulator n=1 Tax=Marinobacter bohaiensis TaxID=2201898 RepID=UPI001955133E|nr:IclR family transcriptional regulator [Marinobacter bohaiensis]